MPVIADRVLVSVNNILFATDFSEASKKAAAYAKALALNFRSKVDVVHVFDPSVVTSYVEAVVGLPVKERRQIYDKEVEQEMCIRDRSGPSPRSPPTKTSPSSASLPPATSARRILRCARGHDEPGRARPSPYLDSAMSSDHTSIPGFS